MDQLVQILNNNYQPIHTSKMQSQLEKEGITVEVENGRIFLVSPDLLLDLKKFTVRNGFILADEQSTEITTEDIKKLNKQL